MWSTGCETTSKCIKMSHWFSPVLQSTKFQKINLIHSLSTHDLSVKRVNRDFFSLQTKLRTGNIYPLLFLDKDDFHALGDVTCLNITFLINYFSSTLVERYVRKAMVFFFFAGDNYVCIIWLTKTKRYNLETEQWGFIFLLTSIQIKYKEKIVSYFNLSI